MEQLISYFPALSNEQIKHFEALKALYVHWNAQINVISRKDMDAFYERHVLHSLAIAKVIQFQPGTKIMDVGTGGGFPGVPLAIMFPDCDFLLIDSIGKKVKVVREVADALGLQNLATRHERAEAIPGKFDFIVSRAVTAMPTFLSWVEKKISKEQRNALPNGILYLKGGDLSEEFKGIRYPITEFPIPEFFTEAFFETKKVIHVTI